VKYDQFSFPTFAVFVAFVGVVLALSFFLGRRAKSAKGYYAAHGQINWFVNGFAFAGDYLSAASFLGICGIIAFYGYDGFLYSIGYLAGWVVALFVVAEPLKRMGKFTFADALDKRFNSRGIKLAAAISTLVVSVFYLIPQMVGAGTLIQPLLGLPSRWAGIPSFTWGVVVVGLIVILIVVTAGMVSTTWVQFIKGSLLVVFCFILTIMILRRGLAVQMSENPTAHRFIQNDSVIVGNASILPATGGWTGKPYVRVREPDGRITVWRESGNMDGGTISANYHGVSETQWQTVSADGKTKTVNGRPWGTHREKGEADFWPVGQVAQLPDGKQATGPLGPLEFLRTFQDSTIVTWGSDTIKEPDGSTTTVYYQKPTKGSELLTPGNYPTFKGIRSSKLSDKLDFISLMLALFCGTASLPHILIRYYTVKDQAAARKSTVVGIASIGFFYVLTLYLGLGAMTSGTMDVTNNNMAAPLLARSFGQMPFAVISAIAFTTVLGTVSGLIMAAAGAVAHDLMQNVMGVDMNDYQKVRAGKIVAVFVGVLAMALGVVFQKMNVTFLVGWAFNVAASANLPALVMLLFWRGTTKRGITVAIVTGLVASLAWLLRSAPAFKDVYGMDPARAPAPFSQPGLVTIPLGFAVLIVVSLLTRKRESVKGGFEVVMSEGARGS
jgi:cation/acetate symporter